MRRARHLGGAVLLTMLALLTVAGDTTNETFLDAGLAPVERAIPGDPGHELDADRDEETKSPVIVQGETLAAAPGR